MRTRKFVISKIGERGMRIIPAAALAATLGMLALGGCSSQNADVPPETPMVVNFALDKCQQLEAEPLQMSGDRSADLYAGVQSHRRELRAHRPQGQRLRPARRLQPLSVV